MPAWDFEAVRRLLMTDDDEGFISDKEAGARLGVSERVVREVKNRGLNDYEADYFAVKVGTLPMVVWAGWAKVSEEEIERQAQEAEAGYRLGDQVKFVFSGNPVVGTLVGFPKSTSALYVQYEDQRVYVRKAEAKIRPRRKVRESA